MEKTEEQIAKERAAVDSMRGATKNMSFAISRIDTLEWALKAARAALVRAKGYIGEDVYTPHKASMTTCHKVLDDDIAAIDAKLS